VWEDSGVCCLVQVSLFTVIVDLLQICMQDGLRDYIDQIKST